MILIITLNYMNPKNYNYDENDDEKYDSQTWLVINHFTFHAKVCWLKQTKN